MKQNQKKRVPLLLEENEYWSIRQLAEENQYSLPGYIRQILRVHLRELEHRQSQ